MLGVMAAAVALTQIVQLPDIVGAFLAGLAVNTAVQQKPAKEKLEFIGNSFFIPMTIWSLTLPQVAATLAATLVGFDTINAGGERLVDARILDVVFVLILVTATLGPIMTQRYAPLMMASSDPAHKKAA